MENDFQKNPNKKKIFIIIGAILGILIIGLIIFFIVVNNIKNEEKRKLELKKQEYENVVSSTLKEYFTVNNQLLPKVEGECVTVSVDTFIQANFLENEEIKNTCDTNNTYGKACKLKDGTIHYSSNLNCGNIRTSYNDYKEGTASDLTANADVKFLFLAQEIDIPNTLKNQKEETYWKDEIPYSQGTYTVIGEKTYYREKNLLYRYYTETKKYYPNDATNEYNNNYYYVSMPNNKYQHQGKSATVYKWYIESNKKYPTYESEKIDNYTIQGEVGTPKIWASLTSPENKDYRKIVTGEIYRTRQITNIKTLVKTTYQCSNELGTEQISSDISCELNEEAKNKGLTNISYMCYYDDGYKTNYKISSCEEKIYTYSNWSNYSTSGCIETDPTKEPHTCEKENGYIITDKTWAWYTPSVKTYYPSNATSKDKETTYYEKSPVANALKDESTKTIGYKWYKVEVNELGYHANAPMTNAIIDKNKTKWSEFSSYALLKPVASEAKYVEERVKITLKKSSGEVASWKNITDGYVTLEELLNILNDKGYKVNTLEDILNSEKLKCLTKMYYKEEK